MKHELNGNGTTSVLLRWDWTLSFSSSQLWYSNSHQYAAISSCRHWASRAVSSLKRRAVSWAVSPLAGFPHLAIDHRWSTSMGLVNAVTCAYGCGRPAWNGTEINRITLVVWRWQNGKRQISHSIFTQLNGTETSPFLSLLLYNHSYVSNALCYTCRAAVYRNGHCFDCAIL